jgi:hypothetical protein
VIVGYRPVHHPPKRPKRLARRSAGWNQS